MTAPLPTSPALTAELATLTARLRGTLHRPDLTLDRLLRLQHHATLASLDPRPITTTHPFAPPVKVFNILDRYQASGAECHDDEPEAA